MGLAPRSLFRTQMSGQPPVAPARPLDPAADELAAPGRVPSLVGGAAFVVDQGLCCLVAEGDAVRVAGLRPDDVVGRPLAEILDPLLAARLEPHCRLALDGQPFVYEHEANARVYVTRGLPLPDDRGGVPAALVVTYDITDQQQAEALRRRGEEAFSALIEHAPFAVAVVDATLRLRATNQAADVLLDGIDAPHGRSVVEIAEALWPGPEAADAVRQFRRTLATGEPYVAPRRAAGTGRMDACDWQLRRIALPDGTAGVVCYAYDVTPIREAERAAIEAAGERSKAEARLHDSETRLRLALDASDMGTFVWHVEESRGEPDGRALELLGLTGGASSASQLAALVHVDDRAACVRAVEGALDPAGPGVLHQDFRRQDPDGAVRWLAISARTTFAGTPRRAVSLAGVIADIDDRKRTEAALREREEMLVEADRRKDEFLAVLAHELRNPLAPLRAGLELIRLSGDASPAVERTRAIMERQVGHMVRLIDDLLDVSRITSGKIQLQRRPTPIDLLIATAVDANREAITSAQLLLEVRLPDPPVWVDADPTRGVQIISNVLHNAVKFSDTGGRISVSAAVEPAAAGAAAALALTIADTGVGIRPEMLPRVFDLFTQDRATTGRSQAGLGIGLALARRLVEMHGGTIAARSAGPGCGCAITIRLPVSDADAPATPPAGRTEAPASRHRVLIVDDNLDAAHAMAMVIAALGGDARVSGDGAGALDAVADWLPTLVLLDIGMPGMDGYETCRRIRAAMGSRLRIVALTGWGQEQDKRDAERAGFDAHITKPADPATLERLLAELAGPD